MKNEREDKLKVNLSASDGIPKVSFAVGAEGGYLSPEEYNIAGNVFTAYYDGAHKLVFVLDNTVDDRKPNVLLVINPIGDRKWDDILANDYNVDLETVRPKVDNKYQKLDIDYNGLSVYNKLINDFNNDVNLSDALAELSNFRNMSVRHSAADRLRVANESIAKTHETISKTGETMREYQARVKKLREKLSKQKKEIGREPTKQSAAKILKTEAQIDAANDKLKRSKKRLNSAERRLAAATADAEIAQSILDQKFENIPVNNTPVETVPVFTEQPRAEIMADEEVKPLFEKDPEILDENIAFKPIDFGAPRSDNAPNPIAAQNTDDLIPVGSESNAESAFAPVSDVPPAPLSFTPPIMSESERITETTSVPQPAFTPTPIITQDEIVMTEPVIESDPVVYTEAPQPVQPSTPVEPVVADVPQTPAPSAAAEARPVSPITGTANASTVPVGGRNKPNMIYYIMLIILIALSVFTLWLYQKSNNGNIPELTATTPVVEEPAPEVVPSPFIQPEPAPIVEPEPIVMPEPVYYEPEPEYVPEVPVEAEPEYYEPEYNDEPVYNTLEDTLETYAPTPEPVVMKPAYDVGSERTFVADDYYETDRLPDGTYYDDYYQEEYYE